jgi:hypothetical protein
MGEIKIFVFNKQITIRTLLLFKISPISIVLCFHYSVRNLSEQQQYTNLNMTAAATTTKQNNKNTPYDVGLI